MNPFIKQLANQKMNRMTPSELENFGKKYGLNINSRESTQVMRIVRSHPVDIFQDQERRKLLREIAKTTNPELAKNMETLFKRFLNWANRQGLS
jgi:hypothetical protein